MRPIGNQIRAILAASEALQRPAPAAELARRAGVTMQSTLCTRICRRAESYGLMDVADMPGSVIIHFIARPGWFAAVQNPKTFNNPRIRATPKAGVMPSRIINSVFALGAA